MVVIGEWKCRKVASIIFFETLEKKGPDHMMELATVIRIAQSDARKCSSASQGTARAFDLSLINSSTTTDAISIDVLGP